MILKQIEINRLFNHYHSIIPFTEGINVITGENGSGKTSIVESIYLALYCSTFKGKKREEIFHHFKPNYNSVKLETDNFTVFRRFDKPEDWLLYCNKRIFGRENITKEIEKSFISRSFFQSIVYTSQDRFLDIVELSPSEKEMFVNKILNLDYITNFAKLLTKNINILKAKKTEIQFLMKRLEASKEERKRELIEEIATLRTKIDEVKKELEDLEKKKLSIEAKRLIMEKEKWLKDYWKCKKLLKEYEILQEKQKEKNNLLLELKEKKKTLEVEIKNLKNQVEKYRNLLKEGKCIYCERPLEQKDYERYEQAILDKEGKVALFITSLDELEKSIESLKKELNKIKYQLDKLNPYKIKSNMLKLRQKCLEVFPLRKLKELVKIEVKESEIVIFRKYEEVLKLYQELEDRLQKAKWEYELILKKSIKKDYQELQNKLKEINKKIDSMEDFKKVIVEKNLAGEIRWQALSQTGIEKIFEIFDLGKLSFNKNFEFFIDKFPLHLASGSQKVATALAIRLAFLNLNKTEFLILDEPTMFLDKKRIEDLMEMIMLAYSKKLVNQIILITHEESFKEIAHNLIKVKKDKEGAKIEIL